MLYLITAGRAKPSTLLFHGNPYGNHVSAESAGVLRVTSVSMCCKWNFLALRLAPRRAFTAVI